MISSTSIQAESLAKRLENLQVLDDSGIAVSKRLKNKKGVILQFWASWCTGCGENMKTLMGMTEGSSKSSFVFIPISIDDNKELALTYFKTKGPELNKAKRLAVWDENASLTEGFGVTSVPALVILNEKGGELLRVDGHISADKKKAIAKIINNCCGK